MIQRSACPSWHADQAGPRPKWRRSSWPATPRRGTRSHPAHRATGLSASTPVAADRKTAPEFPLHTHCKTRYATRCNFLHDDATPRLALQLPSRQAECDCADGIARYRFQPSICCKTLFRRPSGACCPGRPVGAKYASTTRRAAKFPSMVRSGVSLRTFAFQARRSRMTTSTRATAMPSGTFGSEVMASSSAGASVRRWLSSQ